MDGFLVWEGYLKQELKRYEDEGQLDIILGMYVKQIVDNGIICEPTGTSPNTFDVPAIVNMDAERLIACDTVVVGTGREPLTHMFNLLRGNVPELYAIGDCVKPGWAHNATREGADIGITI